MKDLQGLAIVMRFVILLMVVIISGPVYINSIYNQTKVELFFPIYLDNEQCKLKNYGLCPYKR